MTPTIAASAIFEGHTRDRNSPAFAVLHYLESSRPRLACEWARRTLLAALPFSDEPNREALADWLTRLPILLDSGADRESLVEESRRIWYAFPRTGMQTAVSKLFGAAADFQAGSQRGYFFGIHAAFVNARKSVESIQDAAKNAYEGTVNESA